MFPRHARPLLPALVLALLWAGTADAAPAPGGVSAIALDGRVALAWQPSPGATGYRVLRGTSPSAITQQVSPSSLSATRFTDTTAANGQTFYYAVRALDAAGASPSSRPVAASPRARSCTTGSRVAVDNCFPGTTAWKVPAATAASNGGIEGFATRTSIDGGQAVDLKVATGAGVRYRIEIYRTGWYRGSQGRLISTLPLLSGVAQPACVRSTDNTGLRECSNWSATSTITTTRDWPSGVYLLKLVREDNGTTNHVLLTVRDDSRASTALFGVPVTTYQAYNNHGGKSLYDFNSSTGNTVAGTRRAVKVSFDRPYQQSVTRQRDWYPFADLALVSWLERQGYDLSYATSVELHTGVPGLTARRAVILPSHDEYWSAQMRAAVTGARDAGVGLAWFGSNNVYWRVRFEPGRLVPGANRTLVCYKSTQSGPADPSGEPTGTWRDPNGARNPENALLGAMYVGDNDTRFFPLVVSAAQGRHPIWRGTSLASLPAGTSAAVGRYLVGWEWDARVANGREPAGVQTVASSPVIGNILRDAGRTLSPGSTNAQAVAYRAASGALVFDAGTNHWARGLALDMRGVGEPNASIQQATANILTDMGTRPGSPSGVRVIAARARGGR